MQRDLASKLLFLALLVPTVGRKEAADQASLQAVPWAPVAPWTPQSHMSLAQTSSSSGQSPGGIWSWSRIESTGVKPMGREGHASVTVGQRIYYIGGCVQEIQCFNDVHIFDTMSLQWIQEPITGDAPEPRGGHTATLVGTDIWVFGGASSEATYESVYKLDLINKHWTRAVPTSGDAEPSKRTNHAAAADAHGKIYMFGGYDAEGNFLNEVWILNVFWNGHWDNPNSVPVVWEHPIPSGQIPTARESHSLTVVQRKLVLFGGYTTEGHCVNDVHVYDLDRQDWSAVPSSGVAAPAPRQAHSAARHGLHIIVAGGCDVGAAKPLCYNDVWSLDTVGMRWTQMSPDAITWFPREGHTANFVRGQMFVFGGCQVTAECYNDVTVLNTLDPCPGACGGRGVCRDQSFCQCSAGFAGHDCLDALTCPMDCGGHGLCSSTGQCVCDNGFTGPGCTIELNCPGTPAKCSDHGTCSPDGTCHCLPGYSGADCSMGSAICPMDCSGNGVCHPDAKCACHPGWAGEGCNMRVALLEEHCAMDCCGRGHCGSHGCQCAQGWYGEACNLNTDAWAALRNITKLRSQALLQEAKTKREQAEKTRFLSDVLQRAGGEHESGSVVAQVHQLNLDVQGLLKSAASLELQAHQMPKLNAVKALGDVARTCSPVANMMSSKELLSASQMSSNLSHAPAPTSKAVHFASKGATKKSNTKVPFGAQNVPPPSNEDFGIEKVNEKGVTGIQEGECAELNNCNFRGICKDGTCYCQKNFYGPDCGTVREKKTGTLDLGMTLAIAGGCMTISFLMTLCFLNWTAAQRRNAEAKLGYTV